MIQNTQDWRKEFEKLSFKGSVDTASAIGFISNLHTTTLQNVVDQLEGMKAPIENKLYPSDHEKYRNKVISDTQALLRKIMENKI